MPLVLLCIIIPKDNILKERNSMKSNFFIKISLVYWIVQAMLIFSITGIGFLPQLLGIALLLLSTLLWVIRNITYNILFALFLILYSVCFLVGSVLFMIFFRQEFYFQLTIILIIISNFFLSIKTLIISRNNHS